MITKHYFGTMDDGNDVYSYLLKNDAGMSVRICEFGGAIMEISVPDRLGRMTDVVAGYDSLRDYVLAPGYLGALVGRVCNRIAKGKFRLGGKEYQVYKNNNGNSLHGGKVGFSHKIWDVKAEDGEEPRLILTLVSPDGDENYPGTLNVTVTYTLLRSNALAIHYEATTDKKTVVNLTNHAYFNLGGFSSGKIFDHVLQMDADKYIPTDENLIPTGEIRSVVGTPFDFREPKTIGEDFDLEHPDMKLAGGFDHCLCFAGGETKTPVLRIEAYEPNSGRLMQVYTNQPCVQLYTANMINEQDPPFKGNVPQSKHCALCLETQAMPDSINHENFTNCVLRPGEVFDSVTEYKFTTR